MLWRHLRAPLLPRHGARRQRHRNTETHTETHTHTRLKACGLSTPQASPVPHGRRSAFPACSSMLLQRQKRALPPRQPHPPASPASPASVARPPSPPSQVFSFVTQDIDSKRAILKKYREERGKESETHACQAALPALSLDTTPTPAPRRLAQTTQTLHISTGWSSTRWNTTAPC